MLIRKSASIVATFIGSLFATEKLHASSQPRALLITGNGNAVERNYDYPNWNHEFHNERIAEILTGIVEVTVTEDLSTLNDRTLATYDLVLNNSMFLTPSPEQLDAFYRFIADGGSYLAVHAGLVSFLNSERYEDLIGGRFISGEESESFEVFTFDSWYGFDYNDQVQHPVVRGVPNFTIQDELYLVQTNTSDLEVIARAEHHPVMWWRAWESGKVMCLTLGHGASALNNAGYQTLLRNGVRWLVGYPLLQDIPNGRFPLNADPVDAYCDLDALCARADDGEVAFSVTRNTAPQLVTATIDPENRLHLDFSPDRKGSSTIEIRAENARGLADSSSFEVRIDEKGTGNLALYHGVSASASSNEERKFTANPAYAIDGRPDTRWSSDYRDPSWISIDLQEPFLINRVKLLWEGAYGSQYSVEVSSDAKNWKSVHAEDDGDGGVDDIAIDPVAARYVRLYGTRRATRWGYSLFEFEVYGDPIPAAATQR